MKISALFAVKSLSRLSSLAVIVAHTRRNPAGEGTFTLPDALV